MRPMPYPGEGVAFGVMSAAVIHHRYESWAYAIGDALVWSVALTVGWLLLRGAERAVRWLRTPRVPHA